MEILGLFTLFALKHLIADYYLQFSWMIKHKAIYGHWKGLAHSEFHGFLTLLVLWFSGYGFIWSLLMGVLDTALHYHIDYVKSNIWKSKNLGPSNQMYWAVHGTDQFLHMMTYVLIIFLGVA